MADKNGKQVYFKGLERQEMISHLISMRVEKMASTKTIMDFLMNEIGFGETAAYLIFKEARTKIMEIYESEREESAKESIAQLEAEMETAKLRKDHKHWLELRKELNKIKSLHIERVEHTHNVYEFKVPGLDIKKDKSLDDN